MVYYIGCVVGAPDAGKGTLLGQLISGWHIAQPIEVGELCREQKAKNTELWQAADRHMTETHLTLWPDELIMKLLDPHIESALQVSEVVLFDGFPRTKEQNTLLLNLVREYHVKNVLLIHVRADDKVCIERAKERDRADDRNIVKRLSDYRQFTKPAIHALMGLSDVLAVERLNFDGNMPKNEALAEGEIFCDILAKRFRLKSRARASAFVEAS